MHQGFEITFREMLPDSGIVELVLGQLARVPRAPDRRCSVVLRRLGARPNSFGAQVELGNALTGEGAGADADGAVRSAFANLRCRLRAVQSADSRRLL